MSGPWDEIAIGLGVFFAALGLLAFRKTRQFIARCRTAEGTIAGFTADESDEGPPFHFAIIRFTDASGVPREIPGSHGEQKPPVIGSRVSLTYDPDNPSNAWITGTGGPWFLPRLVTLLGIAAIIAGVIMRVVP